MKKIISLLIILLLTGCTCDYDIKINKDKIDESVTIGIPKSSLVSSQGNGSVGDSAGYLIDHDLNPLVNNDSIYYEKEITDNGDYKDVNLKYSYNPEVYKNLGYVLNNCFENVEFIIEDGYQIHLSGQFYCLYNEDEINITISSDNKISSANGMKTGNIYKWVINKDNYNNVDIKLTISSMSNVRYYVYVGIAIFFLVIILIFGYKFYEAIANRNNINRV